MAQVINTNSLSLITQNNINKNQSSMSTAIERLSSGLRINSAKDDAAGQAIANRFTSNIKGLTQAARNANDGISVAQTTEGALSEINNNLQRIRELTVQSQNGTNSKSDLSSIQDEIKSRLDEIDRVSGQTQFNGVNVLAKDGKMNIQVGANDGETITIDLKAINSSVLGLKNFDVNKTVNVDNIATTATTELKAADLKYDVTKFSFTDGNNTAMSIAVDKTDADKLYVTDGDNYYAAQFESGTNTLSYSSATPAAGVDATTTTAVTTGQDLSVGGGKVINSDDLGGFTNTNTAANPSLFVDDKGDYFVKLSDNSYRNATVTAADGKVSFNSSAASVGGSNVDYSTTSVTGITGNDASTAITGVVKDSTGALFATVTGTGAGTYAATVAADGKVTLTGSAPATPAAGGTTAYTSTPAPTGLSTTALKEIDVPSSSPAVTVDTDSVTGVKNAQLFALKDGSGYVVKGTDDNGKDVTFKATVDAAGKVTKGDQVTADPLSAIDDAISNVDTFRSSLGAIQNRLDSAITNLSNTTTNLSEAQSRIQDADYATEVSNMSKAQIIQQAGNSVLAKANQVPQQVLSLLQG